ncbi:glycosyltransferase family 1 protein [Maribacter algicola]|uniref:Glycosyltransferase family 1 protein n=1 Tax=Maribacter algicola TaxID=2498892 RepID=A0A426RIK2_9FLAO|nr:glycosyltransferase [Maribacter algicola]RRQ48841.1 glycosyltransferase family 1 protein [Maribacter algicola]
MIEPKICCIFNLAPHYRAPIFKLMDQELGCDFYFGDRVQTPIKTMEVTELKGYQKTLKNIYIPKTGFEWQKGAWTLIFKPYTHYIITGTPGSLSNWLLLIWSKLLGKKVFAWSHGIKGNETKNGLLIAKNFYKLCDKILLYGERGKTKMEALGFASNNLVPIYNSLDYKVQWPIRQQLKPRDIYYNHFNNHDPVLIYVGRIQKRKKLDLLVQAVHDLNQEGTHCNLVIVGSDVDDNELPKMVEMLGIQDKVWFFGPCYLEEKIAELLFNAAVCVTPGPVGLTALHALTYGCPVISNDNFENQMPEYESIVPGVSGDFFQDDNLTDLKHTITSWITMDDKTKKEVRDNASKLISEKYNPNYQIEVLQNILIC